MLRTSSGKLRRHSLSVKKSDEIVTVSVRAWKYNVNIASTYFAEIKVI
jgi:phage gp16-like protein